MFQELLFVLPQGCNNGKCQQPTVEYEVSVKTPAVRSREGKSTSQATGKQEVSYTLVPVVVEPARRRPVFNLFRQPQSGFILVPAGSACDGGTCKK